MQSEAELTERLRCPAEILSAVELWFFRDLGETQRRQLFNWCGFPGVEANGEELQRKLLSTIIAALRATNQQALAERDAEIARLRAVAWNWLSYDQLLRQYSGPMERIGAGEWELADTTYDKCVKATVAALGGTDAE